MLSTASFISLYILTDTTEELNQGRPQDTWNFSRLDSITLAAFLDNKYAAFVSITQMYLYTVLAYWLLFKFSSMMSEFEFFSSNALIDRFVANHSLVITGINTALSTEQAQRKVKKVFDYRFRGEDTKVLSCNAFRKTENVQKHWRKVKSYTSKLAEFEQESFASGENKYIKVGSVLKCNKRKVEGSKYYGEKLQQAQQEWQVTKQRFVSENQGVVILVFKTKSCAEQVYEELFKMLSSQRLIQQKNEFFKELKFHQWKVHPGIPSEDIIWQNIFNLKNQSSCGWIGGYLSPLLVSSLAISAILILEAVILHYVPSLALVLLYGTTTLLVIFSFYATPYLVYQSVEHEKHSLKSDRETAFIRRLLIIMILNVLVIPVLFNILLVCYCPDGYR